MKTQVSVMAWLVLLLAVGTVSAENDARVYSVMSLVGDQINVVNYQPVTGSSLDRNVHNSIPVKDRVFDKEVLLAIDTALSRHDAGARVRLLVSSAPALFEQQDRFFEGNRIELPKEIESVARTDGATHLILVTKYRSDAKLQMANGKVGSGKLEGLGFYVDREMATLQADTGERGWGFLAPFVYIKVSLIDLKTSTVVREQPVTATTTLSTAQVKAGSDPWDALSPAEKVRILQQMIKTELADAVPKLIARP